jgi:hypothetical protein
MGREKLIVEQKAEELIAEVARLIRKVPYKCSSCLHAERSADSTYFNIGEGVAVFKLRKKAEK